MDNDEVVQDLGIGGGKGRRHIASCIGESEYNSDGDDDGLSGYSHHDIIPPWWEYVSDDKGGNVSLLKSHHT